MTSMTISDTERREMARRLRMLQSRQFRDEERPEVTTWEGIGAAVLPDDEWQRIDRFKSRDNRTQAVRSVIAGRLADLIEPGEPKVKCVAEVKVDGERLEQLVHDAAVELTGIDRDALLALADELEEDACWEVQSPGVDNRAWMLKDVCDRIREALGASE